MSSLTSYDAGWHSIQFEQKTKWLNVLWMSYYLRNQFVFRVIYTLVSGASPTGVQGIHLPHSRDLGGGGIPCTCLPGTQPCFPGNRTTVCVYQKYSWLGHNRGKKFPSGNGGFRDLPLAACCEHLSTAKCQSMWIWTIVLRVEPRW